MGLTQLEFEIQKLEFKRNTKGLTIEERRELLLLHDEWMERIAAMYGQCLSSFI